MGWVVFEGIVLIGIGAFLFLKPDLMWKLTEQWKSYRADGPSDFYLKSTKLAASCSCSAESWRSSFCWFRVRKFCFEGRLAVKKIAGSFVRCVRMRKCRL